jgi:hypothetical protein
MYLHTGWDKFARAHNLEVGFLLTFLYEGGAEMIVKVFDNTSSRRDYHTDESDEDTDNSVIRVFFLCSEDDHRPIEATSVGFWMFFMRIKKHKAHGTQQDFLV